MTKENIIDMLDGHRLVSDEFGGEVYFDDDSTFTHDDVADGGASTIDQLSDMWKHDGWNRKTEKKTRLMTYNEALGFIEHTNNIVVRWQKNRWVNKGYYFFDGTDIDDYEWAEIDEKGNIGEPHKFEVEVEV